MTSQPFDRRDFDAWFAGFFDGDGCISMEICKRSTNTLGYEIVPMIQIGQAQVAGSIDADGTIVLRVCEDDHMRIEYTFAPRVEVMQLHDDRLMHALGAYCDRLDVTCYVGDRYVKDPDRQHYLWRVSGIDNVKQLLEPMRSKFIVKREQVEILLDDIIPRLEDGVHHDKAGFLEVMYYVDRLTAQNSSSGRKYTLSYFEELWGMEYEP